MLRRSPPSTGHYGCTTMLVMMSIGMQGDSKADVRVRIGKARRAFIQLKNIWSSKGLRLFPTWSLVSIDAYLDISFVKMLQILLRFNDHDLRFYKLLSIYL